ncbi:MAG: hypothetical protein KF778_17000 [Rhodocyclaceae bacterium]|nr:hypothetical protein [Rhodocyclaceae bacterium]
MSPHLTLAMTAAAAAADLLRREFLADARVLDDAGKDLKTQADVAAQEIILAHLKVTGIKALAEESERPADADVHIDRPLWLIDPLDGTLNFSRGFAMAAVSIALWDRGEPVLGVIHDIHHGRVYAGEIGVGAWCDNRPMRVSMADTEHQAILATGFPSGRRYDDDSLLAFVRSVQSYKKVRMLGSAALMLAQVAAGHFDVYEEEDIYLWDVAAGLALVRAAGGQFTMHPGSGPFKVRVRASNGIV